MIVDKLIKSTDFLLVSLKILILKLAQLYIREIMWLHRVPSNIKGLHPGFDKLYKMFCGLGWGSVLLTILKHMANLRDQSNV